jgi:hypothetical protein
VRQRTRGPLSTSSTLPPIGPSASLVVAFAVAPAEVVQAISRGGFPYLQLLIKVSYSDLSKRSAIDNTSRVRCATSGGTTTPSLIGRAQPRCQQSNRHNHASASRRARRDEKAHGRRGGPFHTALDRKVRENVDAARDLETDGKACKAGRLRSSRTRLKIVVSSVRVRVSRATPRQSRSLPSRARDASPSSRAQG